MTHIHTIIRLVTSLDVVEKQMELITVPANDNGLYI